MRTTLAARFPNSSGTVRHCDRRVKQFHAECDHGVMHIERNVVKQEECSEWIIGSRASLLEWNDRRDR